MIIGLVVLAVPLYLWFLFRREPVSRTEAFAGLYGVQLTDRSAKLLDRSLRRSRSLRWLSAIVVTIAYGFVDRNAGFESFLGAIAVGFAIGSLLDEATRPRRAPDATMRASLERRSVFTYVERWVVAMLALAVANALAAGAVLLRLDAVGVPDLPGTDVPGRNIIIASMLGVVTIVAIGAALLRRLVLLPTSADSPDLLAVRHALRMAAVLSVVGAVLVIVGFVGARLGNAASLNDGTRRNALQWISNISTLVSVIAILVGLPLSLRALPRARTAPADTGPASTAPTP